MSSASGYAVFAGWIVGNLTTAYPLGERQTADFPVTVGGLTQWRLDHFKADEQKALAKRLSDPTLVFASDAGADAAAAVVATVTP